MKKLYMIMIIIFSIFVVSDVKAYTVGTMYNSLQYMSNSYREFIACGGNSYCTKNGNLNQQPTITCDTSYCFINFVSFATIQDSVTQNNDTLNYLVQFSDTNGKWYPCESLGGEATCMIPNNKTLTQYEIKFMSANNTLAVNIDLNTINIFNSPADATSQLNNIQQSINIQNQQQEAQNHIINNDDTSGNASDFGSDISNFSVPNESHAFDILGSLNSFIGNIQVSGSCSRISVPIPFTDKNFTLPCMTTDVYSVHFREIVIIWQLICRGVGYYYILVNVLKLVKETLDPFNFKLEVLDL